MQYSLSTTEYSGGVLVTSIMVVLLTLDFVSFYVGYDCFDDKFGEAGSASVYFFDIRVSC